MNQEVNILVPDVGDFSEVDVIEVLIAPGDVLALEQSILTLESDKASMEVPSPYAGVVKTVQVSSGDKVKEGVLVATLEVSEVAATGTSEVAVEAAAVETQAAPVAEAQLHDVLVPDVGDFSAVDVIEVLIKPGDVIEVEQSIMTLESDKASMEVPSPVAGEVKTVQVSAGDKVKEGVLLATVAGGITTESKPEPATDTSPTAPIAPVPTKPAPTGASENQGLPKVRVAGQKAHASPSVRRFARELGADITQINGSGNKGRIIKEDVQNFIKASLQKDDGAVGGIAVADMPEIDFAQFGEIEIKPLTRLQKLSGSNLHRNWVTIPHITQHDEADITELEAFRKSLKAEAERAGVKLTFLPLLMKALVAALQAYPTFNASLNTAGDQLILKQYFHIGVAVDTADGLVVPVVRDVDQKGVLELAGELGELSGKARKKQLKGHEMQGGTFTISSLGGIGGTGFTPIVNAPEVAILGVSRSRLQPVYSDGEWLPRLMLPLSLSYDHRVNDGAEAARFSAYLARILTDMRRILL